MQEEGSRHAPRVDTRVVYDRATGEILHIHQAMALPGGKFPDENALRASAVDWASRTMGRPVQQMDVLSVREEELKPGNRYKVNVQNRCLVAEQADEAAET